MVDEVTKFRFVVKTSYIVSCYQNAGMLSLSFTGVSMLSRAWIRAWIGFDIFADDEPSRDDLRHVSRTFKDKFLMSIGCHFFRDENLKPTLNHAANVRDGSLAVLIGIAARKSIDSGKSVKISELTDLIPKVNKWS